MIKNHNRAGWFGASDTAYIMSKWDSFSFARWWLVKLGVVENTFTTPAMLAGTQYEHPILDALTITQRDRQIRIPSLCLRVNLDGETWDTIKEVKTHKKAPFVVTKAYWRQCQVQSWSANKWCEIIAYQLTTEEYDNYFLPINYQRITVHPISYDPRWIEQDYLPRLCYLAKCLKRRKTPCLTEFLKDRV